MTNDSMRRYWSHLARAHEAFEKLHARTGGGGCVNLAFGRRSKNDVSAAEGKQTHEHEPEAMSRDPDPTNPCALPMLVR